MTGVNNRDRSAAFPHGIQGAADRSFGCTVRAFSQLFPGRRFGGGALAIYLRGEPVVDVWTGYADRRGTEYWTADTGAMVWSVSKGLASTVIHRLVDRGLIDYDMPVAEYSHSDGCSITGGYVYRGPKISGLSGRYVYADYCSGKMWTLAPSGGAPRDVSSVVSDAGATSIASFGEDGSGILYACSITGTLYRFVSR